MAVQIDSEERELWTENYLSHRLCVSSYAGEACGFESAAKMAQDMAAGLFIANGDNDASMFRTFAKELVKLSKDARQKQSEKQRELNVLEKKGERKCLPL